MTIPLLINATLETVRSHARSAAYHRAMASRLADIDCPREAGKHEVSAGISAGRLHYAIEDARREEIDPALIQVAVMEGEAAGVDDADRELPADAA